MNALKIELYLNYEEIKGLNDSKAETDVISVTDFDSSISRFKAEIQKNEDGAEYLDLYCYVIENGITVDKEPTFGLLDCLSSCESNEEVIELMLKYCRI